MDIAAKFLSAIIDAFEANKRLADRAVGQVPITTDQRGVSDRRRQPTVVLLSVVASVKRAGVNPWAYLTHVLTELPARSPGADLTDLLPDRWATPHAGRRVVTG